MDVTLAGSSTLRTFPDTFTVLRRSSTGNIDFWGCECECPFFSVARAQETLLERRGEKILAELDVPVSVPHSWKGPADHFAATIEDDPTSGTCASVGFLEDTQFGDELVQVGCAGVQSTRVFI